MSYSRKNALVTGGTDGVGKEVARGLARAGHRVILVGRDAEKGALVEREMREANRLANEIANRWPALHYLVHSAGVVRGRRELTAEGVESNFAINYLSRFALTGRLLPLLEAAGSLPHIRRIGKEQLDQTASLRHPAALWSSARSPGCSNAGRSSSATTSSQATPSASSSSPAPCSGTAGCTEPVRSRPVEIVG